MERNADISVCKTAYRKLALLYHPDKNKDTAATGHFQRIAAAFNKIDRYQRDGFVNDGEDEDDEEGYYEYEFGFHRNCSCDHDHHHHQEGEEFMMDPYFFFAMMQEMAQRRFGSGSGNGNKGVNGKGELNYF